METNSKPKPTPLDWMRLAAFIDGEGCISLSLLKTSNLDGRRRHMLGLHLSNTDPRLAAWIKNTFGIGNTFMRPRNNKPVEKNHRDVYCWSTTGRKAVHVLKECYPYLLLKKEQAEIAFAYGDLLQSTGQFTVSGDNWQQRDISKRRLHMLKGTQPKQVAERVN